MSTKEERLRDQQTSNIMIEDICGDNESAKEYIYILGDVLRTWDDIQDQDYPVTREQILRAFKKLFILLPANTFFQEHRDLLLSQHLSMYNAWVASNEWEHGDEIDKMYAHVWKHACHELVPIMAYILQGCDKMEETSSLLRKLFKAKLGD